MNKESDFEKYSQHSSDFILKLQYLLTNFKERLFMFENRANQVHQFGISRADLFGRSYEYFIESFYLHEKPQIFIESFELYLNFLKVFKDAPQNEITEFPEKISFFKYIPEKELYWLVISKKVLLDRIATRLSFILLNQQIINSSSKEDHLNMIKEFMLCHLAYLAGCEKQDNNDPIQLKDIPIMYKNRELKDKGASELLFALQRIALGYFLNNCVLNSIEESVRSEFCSVLLSSKDSSEKLDIILQKSGISSSFEALIESSFLLLDNLTESEVELLESRLNPQSQNSDLVVEESKLAPRYVQLPNTYMEFSLQYTRKKCSNCYNYPRANDFLMCLICGECMCISNCNGKPIKVPGNASRHAEKYHMGLGLFFAIDILTFIEIKWPFNMIYFPGPSYVNELGESIIDILKKPSLIKNVDFSKFVLDRKLAEKIKNMIVHHSVGQEIFDQAPNNVHNIFNDLRM